MRFDFWLEDCFAFCFYESFLLVLKLEAHYCVSTIIHRSFLSIVNCIIACYTYICLAIFEGDLPLDMIVFPLKMKMFMFLSIYPLHAVFLPFKMRTIESLKEERMEIIAIILAPKYASFSPSQELFSSQRLLSIYNQNHRI